MSNTDGQALRAEAETFETDQSVSAADEVRVLDILRAYYGPILEEAPPQQLVDLVLGKDGDVNDEDSDQPQPT